MGAVGAVFGAAAGFDVVERAELDLGWVVEAAVDGGLVGCVSLVAADGRGFSRKRR